MTRNKLLICWSHYSILKQMRSYSKISYLTGFGMFKYSHCEAILISGNIQKNSKTAFKILISVRLTSEVVTAPSKVKIRFCGQRWRRFTVYIWSKIRWNIFWNGLKKVLPLIKSIFMLHSFSTFSQGSSTNSRQRQFCDKLYNYTVLNHCLKNGAFNQSSWVFFHPSYTLYTLIRVLL